MRTALFALFIFASTLLYAQSARVEDAQIEEVGKTPVEAKFASGGRLRMDLCNSGIDVIGRDEDVVRVSYHGDRDDAQRNVRTRIRVSGDQADIKVSNCPRNHFRVTIEVPKQLGLHIRMFAGELNVKDISGDKDVELDFGQLNIGVGNPDDYGFVDASVRSGELDASAFHVEKGGLFRSFDHNGPGKDRLHAHVGAGEIDLR
jgi:hypothetical protein